MNKEKVKENAWIKIMPALVAICSIIYGAWQFNTELKHRDSQEFRRSLWNKKLEAYEQVGKTTAKIVNSTDDSVAFEVALKEFGILYRGSMPLIQDEEVEEAMVGFNSEIRSYKRYEGTVDDLRRQSYKLMKACNKSLHDSWEELVER